MCITKDKSSRQEILVNGYLYDVSNFSHPGGDLIKFYINNGEDATAPFRQFHNRSIAEAGIMLQRFPKRKAEPEEIMRLSASAGVNNNLDPSKITKHEQLNKDFHTLFKQLEKEGYFKPSPPYIIYRICQLLLLLSTGIYLTTQFSNLLIRFFGMILIAVGAGQSGWVMHEAGHYSLTGRPKLDRVLQSMIFGFSSGFSASWWRAYHNRHHAQPQRKGRDSDYSYLPLIAFHTQNIETPEQGRTFFIRFQKYLYAPLDGFLIICFWKFYKSPRYAIHKRAWLDLACIGIHFISVYYLGVFAYMTSVWLTSIYTLGNLALNHTHTPVTDEDTHWVEHALTHTADIAPHWFVDWWMGYLNYHVLHHLFPSIPLFRGREIMPKIKKFAEEHGFEHQCHTYFESIKLTMANVDRVSKLLQEGI